MCDKYWKHDLRPAARRKALQRYTNIKSLQIIGRFTNNEISYPDALAEIQALSLVVLETVKEQELEKGKVQGYAEAIKEYRRMQEKMI